MALLREGGIRKYWGDKETLETELICVSDFFSFPFFPPSIKQFLTILTGDTVCSEEFTGLEETVP